MIENLLKLAFTWLSVLIFIEAVVEIFVASEIFIGLRAWLSKISPKFFGKLFSCGYCLSVWISLIAIMLPGRPLGIWIDHWSMVIIDAVIRIFVAHRLSNMLHELFQRWLDRQLISLTINIQSSVDKKEADEIEIEVDDEQETEVDDE
jgi:hypothetical protein